MTPLEIILLVLAAILATALWTTTKGRLRDDIEHRSQQVDSQRTLQQQVDHAHSERERLLNAMTEAFLLIDHKGQILFSNKAANGLFFSKTLTNRSVNEAFTDPRLSRALTKGLKAGKKLKTRITLPQQASPLGDQEKRGINSWIVDVAPLPAIEGTPVVTRAIIRDITVEQQTEQIRKDFVANASHELRTPMAIIHGYLENLLDDDMLEEPEMTRKFLTIMRKHSDRIARIIDDMLIISRLESGEHTSLNIEPFSLKDCVNDIIERLESVIRSQEAKVELKFSDDTIQIQGDRFYWTQALFNLIENALKQNPRAGLKVEVGCITTGQDLKVWVSDDGIGIPSAHLPFIFRRFYRVDKQHTNSEIKGTGLGLSIAKRAVEAHQGTIIASSIPGNDTRFLITAPLAGPNSEPSEPELLFEDFAGSA